MFKTVLVTAPTSEPITIDEANDHLKLSGEDTYVSGLIVAARRQLERYLNRALITQTWKVYYDCFHPEMKIPFGSLQTGGTPSVDPVVKYRDLNGTLQTLASSNYWVIPTTEPATILKGYDVTYPETQYGRPDAVEITFTCGYGDSDSVPEDIRHAMKILITNYHEQRGDIVIANMVTRIPHFITDLIHSYKIYNF
jgi:uncharacterized phiE125 gp8 family phage protein